MEALVLTHSHSSRAPPPPSSPDLGEKTASSRQTNHCAELGNMKPRRIKRLAFLQRVKQTHLGSAHSVHWN